MLYKLVFFEYHSQSLRIRTRLLRIRTAAKFYEHTYGTEALRCDILLHLFFSIDNKKSIQRLIFRHVIGMIAVNMRYITAIDP